MRCAGLVVAAGRGERFGGAVPKALVPVAGVPLVVHAVRGLRAAGATPVVVVHPLDAAADVATALDEAGEQVGPDAEVRLVPGGATRSDSVRAGLAVLPDDVEVVAVHDAARGLQPAEVVTATIAAVRAPVVAAAPARPVTDTLKQVDGDRVVGTVDRDVLVAVQTPQVVDLTLLRAAHEAASTATDDLGQVEDHLAAGGGPAGARIVHVPGSRLGTKVTFPDDVAVIEALRAHTAEAGRQLS